MNTTVLRAGPTLTMRFPALSTTARLRAHDGSSVRMASRTRHSCMGTPGKSASFASNDIVEAWGALAAGVSFAALCRARTGMLTQLSATDPTTPAAVAALSSHSASLPRMLSTRVSAYRTSGASVRTESTRMARNVPAFTAGSCEARDQR